MRGFANFLKTTLVGGLFFLLPLGLTVMIVGKVIGAISKVVVPVAELLPFQSVVGLKSPDILAIVLLLAVCFLAGLLAKTDFGRKIADRAEELILKKVPGYTILRSMTSDQVSGPGARMETALAWIEESWVLAFIVERPRHPEEFATVFVPSAPTPAAGTIYYLPESRVRAINVPVKVAVKLIMQLGVGSHDALKGKYDFPSMPPP